MNTEESKDFYSIQEVAEKLCLSVKSVRRYIAAGNLNSIKIGGAYRIPSGALEEFINDGSKNKNIHYDLFGNIVVDKPAKKKNDIVNWIDIKFFCCVFKSKLFITCFYSSLKDILSFLYF